MVRLVYAENYLVGIWQSKARMDAMVPVEQ